MAEVCSKDRGGSGRPGRSLTVLALTLLVAGCYSYTQVSPASAPPGSNVQIRVDPRAPLKLGEVPLPDGGRVIRGRLLPGSTADTLICSLPFSIDPALRMRALRGAVLVPVADVTRLEVRRLEKGRTAAAVAAGGLLGFVVVRWAFDIALPNKDGGDTPGGENNARVGLFRLHW